LHRFTTEEEVEHVGARTIEVVSRLREMSPLYEAGERGRGPEVHPLEG